MTEIRTSLKGKRKVKMLKKIAERQEESAIAFVKERVVSMAGNGEAVLRSGLVARRAVSCLVEPQVGDEVLCCRDASGSNLVAVLARNSGSGVEISSPGEGDIQLRASKFSLRSTKDIELRGFGDVLIEAPLGKLVMNVEDLFQTVRKNLVQLGKNMITKTTNWHFRAEGTVLSDSENHVITAKRDLRMDAERINMG